MSLAILTQVYDETRRLAVAGSVAAAGDFRLKKLVAPLEQAGAKAPDKFGLLFDIRLLLFVSALLAEFLQRFLLDEGRVISGITFQLTLREPDDSRRQAIQEISIVADD